MKLTSRVINSIERFVQQPTQGKAESLIKTGTIFRYLSCADQLSEPVLQQLEELLQKYIVNIPPSQLLSVYRAIGTGYFSASHLILKQTKRLNPLQIENY